MAQRLHWVVSDVFPNTEITLYTRSVLESARHTRYRLRGTIDGRAKTFDLPAGVHAVGSSRDADIMLPVTGISRRHARFVVTANELAVEDLDSTNGTAVDGVLVTGRMGVPARAEVRFGPVRLQVEAVTPDDGALALVFDSVSSMDPSSLLSALDPDKSTLMVGHDSPAFARHWLSCIEGLLARLDQTGQGGLERALAHLGETLDVLGCCAVRWTADHAALALAVWGEIHEIPSFVQAKRLVAHDSERAEYGTAFFEDDPSLSVIVAKGPGDDCLGIVLWGDFAGRLASATLLRILLRLIEPLCRRSSSHDAPQGDEDGRREASLPTLVFPSWYRFATSAPMVALYDKMRQLAMSDIPVLIRGETGVGKELIARALHDSSQRRGGPFVAVNCAAIPAELLEAEMFGVERGVATGVDARVGKFCRAEQGTIFLDEIGEMAPALQAKLLRVLQEKEIQPVGGAPQAIDVRIIAATNVDLSRHMTEGKLRNDLYFRLAGWLLEVPALRERSEDIAGLVEHFVRRFASESGIRIRGLTLAALRVLTAYDWPGNVRELEHEIRQVVYMSSSGDVIDAERLSLSRRPSVASRDPVEGLVAGLESLALEPAIQAIEERLIRAALERAGGVKVEAARLLGLSRNGLDKKMKRLGIDSLPHVSKLDEDDGR